MEWLFLVSIIIQLVFFCLLLYIIWLLLYSMFWGAPYAAIGKKRLETMLVLAQSKKGERVADLGAGDGRITIAFARTGATVHGFEINPLLYFIAKRNIQKTKVSTNASVFLQDLWKTNFSSYDVVVLYGNFPMMGRLEKKLQKELKPGARVISNYFQFPNWKPTHSQHDVFLYSKGQLFPRY